MLSTPAPPLIVVAKRLAEPAVKLKVSAPAPPFKRSRRHVGLITNESAPPPALIDVPGQNTRQRDGVTQVHQGARSQHRNRCQQTPVARPPKKLKLSFPVPPKREPSVIPPVIDIKSSPTPAFRDALVTPFPVTLMVSLPTPAST